GGEAIQGGALMGGYWRAKINEGGAGVAFQRLRELVTTPLGASEFAKESTSERLQRHASRVVDLGWTHPEAPVNFVYNTDRMPHWSLPLSRKETLVPFFAPVMLRHMARTLRAPRPYGSLHTELLKQLNPNWAAI